jgi:hypothetical protein
MDYIEMLQRRQIEKQAAQQQTAQPAPQPAQAQPVQQPVDAAAVKEAELRELDTFTAGVEHATEKAAGIVASDHNTTLEQLFRNQVAAAFNMKLAGLDHESFNSPEEMVKAAHLRAVEVAKKLGVPLT